MSSLGRGDDGRNDDLPPVDVVVPDDARELDADARAVRRELRWRRVGLSAPLVIAVLVVVGLVASTLGVLRPRPAERPASLPLAERPPAAPGQVGGLLPPGQVVIDGTSLDVRDLRPAVLVLVPAGCECEQRLDALFPQVQQYSLAMYLVGEPSAAEDLQNLTATIGNGTAVPALDTGVLAGAYASANLTVVLVHADGVVRAVHADLPIGAQLEPELSLLSMPGDR